MTYKQVITINGSCYKSKSGHSSITKHIYTLNMSKNYCSKHGHQTGKAT